MFKAFINDEQDNWEPFRKIIYDRRVRPTTYSVGDLVLVENREVFVGKKKKLRPRAVGPYRIVEKLSEHAYRLKSFIPGSKFPLRQQGFDTPLLRRDTCSVRTAGEEIEDRQANACTVTGPLVCD